MNRREFLTRACFHLNRGQCTNVKLKMDCIKQAYFVLSLAFNLITINNYHHRGKKSCQITSRSKAIQ